MGRHSAAHRQSPPCFRDLKDAGSPRQLAIILSARFGRLTSAFPAKPKSVKLIHVKRLLITSQKPTAFCAKIMNRQGNGGETDYDCKSF
jgi:hypothetical protein